MKKQKQRFLMKDLPESSSAILIWFSVLWPILILLVGVFIMIWSGVNECSGCSNLFENILYVLTSTWGWIGVVLTCVGVGGFIYRIVRAIINALRLKRLSIRFDSSKPDSIPFKSISRNKFDSIFGKESYMPLNEGIKKVTEWMKKEIK
ncbi:hypothetical protein LCGC14_1791950 [marine sediment metagenome]|uniref:Uncharacterized protein n=1 Tax=marine sediment metagenome TaxID=412755 RepID=A0A0F9JRS6_9ZZZZ